MDTWVVPYHFYDAKRAEEWLSVPGKEIFGYHCIEPSAVKFPNSFIERPLIDNKLMFWFAASTKMTGWLYWSVDHFQACRGCGHMAQRAMSPGNATHPALSAFDPADCDWCPGSPQYWEDGTSYVYPGELGPIPTTRLEVTRDALEEWEMLLMLPEQQRIDFVRNVIRSPTQYSLNVSLMRDTRTAALRAVNANLAAETSHVAVFV